MIYILFYEKIDFFPKYFYGISLIIIVMLILGIIQIVVPTLKKVIRIKKINILDNNIYKDFVEKIGTISAFISIISLQPSILSFTQKVGIGYYLLCIALVYVSVLISANSVSKIVLKLNENIVNVYYGDIFKESGLKVIPFNEYFDTIVDNIIISENSLNGIFIKDNYKENIEGLNNQISKKLQEVMGEENTERKNGKKIRYILGTTIELEKKYLISAFTRFDSNNRAYLNKLDYNCFLENFWENIDILYNQREISIPLIGTGITRIEEKYTKQEILELILNSIKFSGKKFKSDINIVLYLNNNQKDIDLYKIKKIYKGE